MNGYQLYLRYDDQVLWLAPRHSIKVVETRGEFETVNYGAGCCGQINDRQYKFVLQFVGGCSYAAALSLYQQLVDFVNRTCDPEVDMLLYRRVWDEIPTVYKVSKALYKMIDVLYQYITQHIYSIDLVFTLLQWPPPGTGVVEIG